MLNITMENKMKLPITIDTEETVKAMLMVDKIKLIMESDNNYAEDGLEEVCLKSLKDEGLVSLLELVGYSGFTKYEAEINELIIDNNLYKE